MPGSNFVTAAPVPDGDGGIVKATTLPTAGQVVGSTALTIVPAVAGKRIYIHGLYANIFTNNTCSFLDVNTSGATVATQIYGPSGNFVLPYSQYPWATCAPGDAFAVSTNNATATTFIGGACIYVQG